MTSILPLALDFAGRLIALRIEAADTGHEDIADILEFAAPIKDMIEATFRPPTAP